jgi:dUTP pyrophosphatase
MNDIKIMFKKLNNDTITPEYQTYGAAGCDIHSIDDGIIEPGEVKIFGTGFCVEIPRGIEGNIRSRSGMAMKHKVVVVNAPGTVDSDYRGEIKIGLINLGSESFEVKKGDRIAQIIFQPIYKGHFIEVMSLSNTSRDTGGFGHTGK